MKLIKREIRERERVNASFDLDTLRLLFRKTARLTPPFMTKPTCLAQTLL